MNSFSRRYAESSQRLPEPLTDEEIKRHLEARHIYNIFPYRGRRLREQQKHEIPIGKYHADVHSSMEGVFDKSVEGLSSLHTVNDPQQIRHTHVAAPDHLPRNWDFASWKQNKQKLKSFKKEIKSEIKSKGIETRLPTARSIYEALDKGTSKEHIKDVIFRKISLPYYNEVMGSLDINGKALTHDQVVEGLTLMPYKRGLFYDQQYYSRNLWGGIGPTAKANREYNQLKGYSATYQERPFNARANYTRKWDYSGDRKREWGMTHEEVLDRYAQHLGLSNANELRQTKGLI